MLLNSPKQYSVRIPKLDGLIISFFIYEKDTSYFKMNRTFLPFLLRVPFIISRGTGAIKLNTTFVEERLGLMHKRPCYQPTGTHPSPRSVLE